MFTPPPPPPQPTPPPHSREINDLRAAIRAQLDALEAETQRKSSALRLRRTKRQSAAEVDPPAAPKFDPSASGAEIA